MAPQMTNVLLSTFPGLSLPATVCLPTPITATISQLLDRIAHILPPQLNSQLSLSTTSGQPLWPSLASIDTITQNSIISLRLSAPLRGGKGGFGSQLRAAGGRMSSRKKRKQGEQNGSSRNLDGRRLRTITEAKNLAEYLALKPEMDAREKEERKKKWQAIVEAAEKKEDEIKSGIKGKGKGLSSEWIEDKEELGDRAREAVLKAMQNGDWKDRSHDANAAGGDASRSSESSSNGGSKAASSEEDSDDNEGVKHQQDVPSFTPGASESKQATSERRFFGFDDDDDEFMSDDEEEDGEDGSGASTAGKGKGRAEA